MQTYSAGRDQSAVPAERTHQTDVVLPGGGRTGCGTGGGREQAVHIARGRLQFVEDPAGSDARVAQLSVQAVSDGWRRVCADGNLYVHVPDQQCKAAARGGIPEGFVSNVLLENR